MQVLGLKCTFGFRHVFFQLLPQCASNKHTNCLHKLDVYTNMYTVFSYRGWGVMGFPTPKLKFHPQALLTFAIRLYYFPAPKYAMPPSLPCHLKNHQMKHCICNYCTVCQCQAELIWSIYSLVAGL